MISNALEHLVAAEKLPSCLLLVGATPIESRTLAVSLLEIEHMPQGSFHPDLHIYSVDEESDLHLVATLHQLREEVALPPFSAPYKVFIIEQAEKMLPAASNGLLKILEEPPQDTFFILSSNYPLNLLSTIRSRLYPLYFRGALAEEGRNQFVQFLSFARRGQWDLILEHIDGEEPFLESFLVSALGWSASTKDPLLFRQVLKLVQKCRNGFQYYIKPKTIFLYLLIQIAIGDFRA